MKKETLRPTLVLLCICAAVGGLLAVINHFTSQAMIMDPAEVVESLKEDYLAILPDATEFELLYPTESGIPEEKGTAVQVVKTNAGYLITALSSGQYDSSPIRVLVGIGTDGKVVGVRILKSTETPGVGSRTGSDSFLNRFVGGEYFSADGKTGTKVDTVTGATKSSKAVIVAVNAAMDAYAEWSAQ
ncbi:MAG: FMN-binding protein [Clostridia bacterium]|nr:FMN-binding protein [Clostridia bacterium]